MRPMILASIAAGLTLAALSGLAAAEQPATGGEPPIAAVFDALQDVAGRDGPLLAQAESGGAGIIIEPGDEPIRYDKKLSEPGTPMDNKSLEELIVGQPVFPPIDGLDPSIWKNKNCGTCHQWTKERLCTQAKTYVEAKKMVERIRHPYGLEFKHVLERWGEGGCQ
jgi:hypothetical protein